MSAKKLLLLDGTALVYRAYYAMQKTALTNSQGRPTGAVLGFINTMLMLVRDQAPDYLGVAFDPPGPTFRHEMYPEYKANRKAAPDELKEQMPVTRDLVRAWPCPILELPGLEADDVLGSYAVQLASEDLSVMIVTGDKDFYQLLGPHVSILNPGRGGTAPRNPKIIGPEGIPEKFGVSDPAAVVDVLALMGDSSDNIPGVSGVGPKTAGKLISEFESVDNLLENLERVKAVRIRERLEDSREDLLLARDLVTIKTGVELPVPLKDLRVQEPGGEAWVAKLRELEFKNLLAEFDDEIPEADAGNAVPFDLITAKGELNTLAAALKASEEPPAVIAALAEGHPLEASWAGLAVAWSDGSAYINCGHEDEKRLAVGDIKKALGSWLGDASAAKTAHDRKRLGTILERGGMPLDGFGFDTMLASYLLNPERKHTLEALVLEREGETLPAAPDKSAPDRWPAREAGSFFTARARAAQRFRAALRDGLRHQDMLGLHDTIELPLSRVLEKMERTGITVDREYLENMSERLEEQLHGLEQACWKEAGTEFNLNSPKQLAEVLFDKLGLPKGKKTKTGYSTDSEVLEMLRVHHPLPGTLLEFRQISKLKSTYVDTLPHMILMETGRIHAQFNQAVAATGRLSSSDPNLQNIPIRTELGREVRRAFIPGPKNWVLLSADYSQIELRIMAHLSEDEAMKQAFLDRVDVHTDTASRLLGIDPEDVTPEQRTQAKAVNFGILYGQGAFGLARTLGIPQSDAQAFIDEYKRTYHGVVQYLDGTLEKAREQGYVTTLMNRRRYLPNLNARTRPVRAAAERLAINTPIQGSAADMIKLAMVRLDQALEERGLEARLLATVHDELLLECPKSEAEALEKLVVDTMSQALELSVPVVVNVGVGGDWSEIH